MNDIWRENCKQLRIHFESNNFQEFLQWSTIQATMFVGNAPYIPLEFAELAEYVPFLSESKVGNPTLFDGWTSGNLIHQMYHLKQWLDLTKQNLKKMISIVEVGGGYGAMALLCRRLGFEGQYSIIDLPELQQIQEWYLSRTIGTENISWWFVPKYCDLLIGLHSIGEMPISERESILSEVVPHEYLFAFMPEFDGANNIEWFTQLSARKGYGWRQYQHPYQENCMYQVGIEL